LSFRALFAFLALPGTVAFAVPAIWLWSCSRTKIVHPMGLLLLLAGSAALLWCVRDFYFSGRGTLAPWSPPVRLVVVGLYRYTRNPMYISVTIILLGWAATFCSAGIFLYAAGVAAAFHLRVVLAEEPWLARTFGDEWQRYAKRVPRWFR